MIRSMTGYGRKEVTGAIHGSIEVRSVNNRYLDIQVKTPRSLAALEPRVKKTVQDRFSRGRFDVFITRNGEQERTGRLTHDEALAAQYIGILRDLKARFSLSGEVDLSLVAGFYDIIPGNGDKEDIETVWPLLGECLGQALDELDDMRG